MPRIGPLRNKVVLLVRDHEIRFMSGDPAPNRFLGESLGRYLSRVARMRGLEAGDLRIITEEGEGLLEWRDSGDSKCHGGCLLCISVQRSIEGRIYNRLRVGDEVFGIPTKVKSSGSVETFRRDLCEHLSIPDVWRLHCAAPQVELHLELRDEILAAVRQTLPDDRLCPQCFSPLSESGTGFEAIWFGEDDTNMRESGSTLWRDRVAWSPNQSFCKLCVSTGIVDVYHMTSGEETKGELRKLLETCPWLLRLSEGDIADTEILFRALNLLWSEADTPELQLPGRPEYMSLLLAVQSRLHRELSTQSLWR